MTCLSLCPQLLNHVAGTEGLLGCVSTIEGRSAMELFALHPCTPCPACRTSSFAGEVGCESSYAVGNHKTFVAAIAVSWGVSGGEEPSSQGRGIWASRNRCKEESVQHAGVVAASEGALPKV